MLRSAGWKRALGRGGSKALQAGVVVVSRGGCGVAIPIALVGLLPPVRIPRRIFVCRPVSLQTLLAWFVFCRALFARSLLAVPTGRPFFETTFRLLCPHAQPGLHGLLADFLDVSRVDRFLERCCRIVGGGRPPAQSWARTRSWLRRKSRLLRKNCLLRNGWLLDRGLLLPGLLPACGDTRPVL